MKNKKNLKIVAVIPAKGTSDRIANKNLRLIDGEPLIYRAIRRFSEANIFDEVWLDTDSNQIIELCSDLDCKIMIREPKYASNSTDGNKLLLNEIKFINADIYCQILCTSPFLEISSVVKGINKVIDQSNNYDSIVAGTSEKLYTWSNDCPNYNLNKIPNSTDLKNTYVESMGLYIIGKKTALANKRRIGEKPFFLELKKIECIDVNYDTDLYLANLISSGLRENENSKIRILSKILSSAVLSDVLDSMRIKNCYINHELNLNIPNKKLFGRAKTLSLTNLNKLDKDDVDIYKSHDIYNHLKLNDILVISNKTNYSFFGEINSSFALRSGASGAIIFGPTRDTDSTKSNDFPVFYKKLCSQDIRGRGKLETFNRKINIKNVSIAPNQLVFIDKEGMVVIPSSIEDIVIKKSIEKLSTEKSIIAGITNGADNDGLIKEFGHF